MVYSYLELKDDLKIGHEVEFLYNNRKYSISHNADGWYLTEFFMENYQSFDSYEELLEKGTINQMRLEEIWNDVIVKTIF